jgi:alpha-galactosidase
MNGSEASATESVSQDGNQVAVFAFLHSSQYGNTFPTLFLRDLDSQANYRIDILYGKLAGPAPTQASGAFWMSHGAELDLKGDFQAAAFKLTRIP